MPIHTRSSSLTPCIFLRSAHTRAYTHTHTCKHDMHTLHACMNMHACIPKHVFSLHVCLSVALVYFFSLSLSLSLLTHTYMHDMHALQASMLCTHVADACTNVLSFSLSLTQPVSVARVLPLSLSLFLSLSSIFLFFSLLHCLLVCLFFSLSRNSSH